MEIDLSYFSSTVWKLHIFSVTQILSEIKFRISEISAFCNFRGSESHNSLEMCKNGIFCTSRILKIDFT